MAVDYGKTAKKVLQALGGEKNVQTVTHCMTRLRFVLADESNVKDDEVKAIAGVMGVVRKGRQYQVIIGNDVSVCYKEILKLGNFDTAAPENEKKEKQKFTVKGWINSVLDMVSGSVTPILPALIGCGMVKLVVIILDLFHVSADLPTYQFLNVIGDTGFYYLPLLLAWSASRKMNCNSVLAIVIVSVLIHPTFITMLGEGPVSFLRIPVTSATYSSSVIPALLSVWFLSKFEPFTDKWFKGWLHTVIKPLVILLVCIPVSMLLLAPLGTWIGTGLAVVLNFMQMKAGWLTMGIYAGLMPLVVMSGMHYAVFPYVLSNLGTLGYDTLQLPAMLCSNMAQAAASAAVALRTKNKDMKAVASASAVSAVTAGITEPALYGVTMRLKKPLIASMLGSGIAGLFAGIMGLKAYALLTPSLLAMPMFISGETVMNLIYGCIAAVLSVVITFILTLVIGWEDPEGETVKSEAEWTIIEAPVRGNVIPLEAVNDETFASGVLGKGFAIEPTEGKVYAPFDGECENLFDTLHAMGLTSESGVSILIHVGLETVTLKGKPFKAHIKTGEHFKKGQLLLEFDIEEIKNSGCETVTPVLVVNADEFEEIQVEKNRITVHK